MKKLILCLCLLAPVGAFADAGVLDGGVDAGDAGPVITMSDIQIVGTVGSDAGVVPAVDAGVVIIPSFDEPLMSAKGFYHAVTTGNGWLIAMFLLFLLVGFIRVVGKRIHAMIPDDTKHPVLKPIEKVLYFIFDTKIGGWVMNWLSAIGGCLSTAAMAGVPVDGGAWKVAIMASTGGTALIELKDDVLEWWDARNAKAKAAAEAEAAAKTAVVAPPPTDVPPPAETPKS